MRDRLLFIYELLYFLPDHYFRQFCFYTQHEKIVIGVKCVGLVAVRFEIIPEQSVLKGGGHKTPDTSYEQRAAPYEL